MKIVHSQTKLALRLCVVLLCLGALFFFSLNFYLRQLMETEVADKAKLVFANVLAVQTYVRETLRPAMFERLPVGEFVMEAMSTSYITRKVMSDLNMARNQFRYRRVALDPRNPTYEANEMERDFIRYFQQGPSNEHSDRFRKLGDEECYVAARPVVFEKACLACHGRPEDAPAVLLERYGRERGFGRVEGEIAGLDMLVMPVERESNSIRRVTMSFVLVFSCGALLILGFNHFFFDRIMVQNIGRLSALLRSRFPVEADKAMSQGAPTESDSIEGMLAAMERFADHLSDAKAQLADYAANLETKVEERTAALSLEAAARQADAQLFVDMLERFSQGLERKRLLELTLEAVSQRFGAQRAGFYCLYSMSRFFWPSPGGANEDAAWEPKELSNERRDILLEGRGIFEPGLALAPVQTAEVVRGGLALGWETPVELPGQERAVLMAVARQLGMALENLEALESILRQKTVLESIFEGIADPLFLLDASGGVAHANEAGRALLDSLCGEDRRRIDFQGLLAELASERRGAFSRETLLADGRSLKLRAYPLPGVADQSDQTARSTPGSAIVYARENTVEKTFLARLQQGEKALAVGKLAAGLAHEINNPLGVILCYAELLRSSARDEEQRNDADVIVRHTTQAQKVLQDLMRFARPKPAAADAVNLAEAVQFIARVFQVRAGRRRIRIETELEPDLPCIRGDASALEQILVNLLVNALDALETPEEGRQELSSTEGRIRISAQPWSSGKEVRLRVLDNGPGVPEEHLPRLFDPFFTTKEVGKGTGLGLAVVYGLVRDMGGRIEVENADGALFTTYFQVAEADDGVA
jgi:signal transduction histidine kinase